MQERIVPRVGPAGRKKGKTPSVSVSLAHFSVYHSVRPEPVMVNIYMNFSTQRQAKEEEGRKEEERCAF
jgi:hypothetical protein